jgi:hypothetical protein
MRCPKCGYHSFDYLDNCKKCGVDLTEQKLRFKYQGYVAPAFVEEAPAEEPVAVSLPSVAETENEAIDFGFDTLPEDAALPLDSARPAAVDAPDAEEIDDPLAIDLAADIGLSLEQPFDAENEKLPGDDLPDLDERTTDFF